MRQPLPRDPGARGILSALLSFDWHWHWHRNRRRTHAALACALLAPVVALGVSCSDNGSSGALVTTTDTTGGPLPPPETETSCSGGLTPCGSDCVDLDIDQLHCGGCGAACEPGEACMEGACAACPAGLGPCLGQCVDLQNDPANCGICDSHCQPGYACTSGACTNPCPPGEIPCEDGACTDLQTDHQHCGACHIACGGDQLCMAGVCTCPGGACGSCAVHDVGSAAPQTVTGSAINAPDLITPSCSPYPEGEMVYAFTAPAGGSYEINGSLEVTTLAVLDGACAEMACDDDVTPKVFFELDEGQTVYVVAEVPSHIDEPFTLEIAPGTPCPLFDLGSAPQTVTGSTPGAPDAIVPSCTPTPTADHTYRFTAPADGNYVFTTAGSSFNTSLVALNGSCFGEEIACRDEFGLGLNYEVLTLPMVAGEAVVIGVSGYFAEGDYVLHVFPEPPPVCPTADLGSAVPQTVTGTTVGKGDALTASCNSSSFPSADVSYTFTAPADGEYAFDTRGTTGFDTLVQVRDGGCNGPELACNAASMGSINGYVHVTLSAGQTVVVSVEGGSGGQGDFVLDMTLSCPLPARRWISAAPCRRPSPATRRGSSTPSHRAARPSAARTCPTASPRPRPASTPSPWTAAAPRGTSSSPCATAAAAAPRSPATIPGPPARRRACPSTRGRRCSSGWTAAPPWPRGPSP